MSLVSSQPRTMAQTTNSSQWASPNLTTPTHTHPLNDKRHNTPNG